MWIMTNNSYLSIVSKDCGPAELLVRARRAGDIEKVFSDAKVTRKNGLDGAGARVPLVWRKQIAPIAISGVRDTALFLATA